MNSTSVLLNCFMNWASNVVKVLINTFKHHHTETLFIFFIFASMSRSRSIYVVLRDLFFIFIFIFLKINRMFSWIQAHLLFCLFSKICPIIFAWLMWIIFKQQKFSLGVLPTTCLSFYQFQAGVGYKSVACK